MLIIRNKLVDVFFNHFLNDFIAMMVVFIKDIILHRLENITEEELIIQIRKVYDIGRK